MKKKIYLLLVLLLTFTLIGCKKDKGDEEENKMPQDTIQFLAAVESIEFSLDCQEQLENCFTLYDNLGEDSWNYDEVLEAFNMLVKYENLLKDHDSATHFISLVEDIPYVITLDDKNKIEAAELAYGLLNDSAKSFLDVSLAYSNLQSARTYYNELEKVQNEIIDQKMINEFITLTNAIPALSIFIYEDIVYVEAAENYYETMSDTAKQKEEVIAAYLIVTNARAHYEQMQDDPSIYEDILVARFIELVNSLPDVGNISLESKTAIEEAEAAYRDLSSDSRELSDVISANDKLYTLRTKYNELVAEKEEQEKEEALLKQIKDFLDLVKTLPTVDSLEKADGPLLADARYAYDELPASVKEQTEVASAYEIVAQLEEKFSTFSLEKITKVW